MAQWECSMWENVTECSEMVICLWWWLLWTQHKWRNWFAKTHKSQFEICLLNWNGLSELYATLSIKSLIQQSMFMLHTEMSGERSQKLILQDCRFTFSWYAKRQLCLLIRFCEMEMHKNGCVCVCARVHVHVFLFLSLYVRTVSDKGSALGAFT
jgi:hypothetical protein